jgi:hypothetical protein
LGLKNHVARSALAATVALLSPLASAQVSEVLPSYLSAGPDPSVAWLMALGFLAFVIVRRTR